MYALLTSSATLITDAELVAIALCIALAAASESDVSSVTLPSPPASVQ